MDEPRIDSSSDAGPRFEERRPPSSPAPVIALVVVLVLVLAAAGWYWLRGSRKPEPPAAGAPAAAAPAPGPESPAEPAIELPPLGASDAIVRQLVSRLSAQPRLIDWLAHDGLVRRFVAAVINVAEGVSPASQVRFLTPTERFSVRTTGGRTVIDEASYDRFDTLVSVFVSLDEQRAARVYRQLHPLFDAAYREVGDPRRDFDQTLAQAIDNLLRLEVPAGPIEVVPSGAGYHLADPALESWTTSEKHLLRLGPENARRVQDKLRALAAALGLPPA